MSAGINTFTYGESNPTGHIDPSGEASAALPGIAVLGVGAAVWMSTPTGRDAVENATRSLARAIQDFCQPECGEVEWRIERAIVQLRVRYVAMSADKNQTYWDNLFGRLGWFNHQRTYREWQVNLADNVRQARQLNCPYNPEADEWLSREPPARPAY